MTTKSDFSNEDWHVILEAPPSAGLIVVTAQREPGQDVNDSEQAAIAEITAALNAPAG